jgi:hypothetical protein
MVISHAMSEKRLWFGVLFQAIQDLADGDQSDAHFWIFSPEISPGSFHWVCNSLGLDSMTIRDRLSKLSIDELGQRLKGRNERLRVFSPTGVKLALEPRLALRLCNRDRVLWPA